MTKLRMAEIISRPFSFWWSLWRIGAMMNRRIAVLNDIWQTVGLAFILLPASCFLLPAYLFDGGVTDLLCAVKLLLAAAWFDREYLASPARGLRYLRGY
ncbi:hypothetical protein [Aeromonas allosaccharophila]|uniref:hypothetical protein n=1 Tax=Aeromonas allosaccharophila TaxID=656 RepID=UPI003D19561B